MTKQGVCVFDIDNTLTCGTTLCSVSQIENMIKSIDLCKQNNMAIEINTARPPQDNVLFGIDQKVLDSIGDIKPYTREPDGIQVEMQKLINMKKIARKHNVSEKKTILFDDVKSTCDLLNKHDIPTVHVRQMNGITNEEYEEFKVKLDNIIY